MLAFFIILACLQIIGVPVLYCMYVIFEWVTLRPIYYALKLINKLIKAAQ